MEDSTRFKRIFGGRKVRKVIYIFTEGKQTEPNYFKSFRHDLRISSVKIYPLGIGYNTLSLVNYAIDFKDRYSIVISSPDADPDEIWVVFDKDNFERDFDNAIKKAHANGIKVAYSNECFELWFLLHFVYIESALDRKIYYKKLSYCFDNKIKKGLTYNKNDDSIYYLLKPFQDSAIKNAHRLLKEFSKEPLFYKKNPSTTVHILVENLNSLN